MSEDPYSEEFDLFEDLRPERRPDRGPNYRECPHCKDVAAMSQAAIDQHVFLAHPEVPHV